MLPTIREMNICKNIFWIIIGLILVTGCLSTKSITSHDNKKYFKESPSVVSYQDRYFLRFVYADETCVFFMMCESKVKRDSLIYYLPATTSSGNLRGKTQFQEIIKEDEIEMIKKKNVFWEEPDGRFILMVVEQIKDEEIKLLPKIKKGS